MISEPLALLARVVRAKWGCTLVIKVGLFLRFPAFWFCNAQTSGTRSVRELPGRVPRQVVKRYTDEAQIDINAG